MAVFASKTLVPWFRLIRLPNLLTVPGDPVAGFLLAAAGAGRLPKTELLMAAAGASFCLYIFGLILNDLVDMETDQLERPERPLPAGEITVPQARMAAIAMALSGLNLALAAGRPVLFCAAVLAGMIVLYNAWLKRLPVVGVLAMGLCRGLSLLMGAFTVVPDVLAPVSSKSAPVVCAAVGLVLYVAGLSAVARREADTDKPRGPTRWLPFLALLCVLPVLSLLVPSAGGRGTLTPTVYVFLMVMALMRAWLLGGMMYRLQPVPVTVGGHIRNLLMVQACFCVASGPSGLLPAVSFVLLSLLFPRFSSRFYSS